MPTDGYNSDKQHEERRQRRRGQDREEGSNLTGQFAAYEGHRDTLLELMWPERFPASADSGSYGVGNSYLSGMAALQQVFNPAGVGAFVRPRENTFIRHELAVIGGRLDFNVKKYEFDKIVAHFAQIPKAFDPKSSQYEKYADLRMNLSVMRNYLLNHFFPDGDVENDLDDRRAAHSMNQIAMHVGDILHRGNGWLPSVGPSVSTSHANVKGEGAAEIYQKLLQGERRRLLLSPVLAPINLVRNRSNMIWRLPALQETPFDPRNLAAPLDTYATDDNIGTYGGGTGDQAPLPDRQRLDVISHSFDDLGSGLTGALVPLATVDDLSQPVKDRAIELAREILEKLKLKFSGTPMDALLDQVGTTDVYQLLKETQRLSDLFYSQASRAALVKPDLFHDPDMQVAFDALGKLSCQAKLQALKFAEESGSSDNARKIAREIEAMHPSWRDPGTHTVGHMLGAVQIGLEKILRHLQEQSHTNSEARSVAHGGPGTNIPGISGLGGGLAQQNAPGVVQSSISPLQQRMQQVMASNEMVNMAAERRSQQQESVYQVAQQGTGASSAPSVAAIASSTPPPRPPRPVAGTTRARSSSSAVMSAAQQQGMGQMARRSTAAVQPVAPPKEFNNLLNSGDLANLRGTVDVGGLAGQPTIGPRRHGDTVREIAASRDSLASAQDAISPTRPGGYSSR